MEHTNVEHLFKFLIDSKKKEITFTEFRENSGARLGESHFLLDELVCQHIVDIVGSNIVLSPYGEYVLYEHKILFKQRNSGVLLKSMLDEQYKNPNSDSEDSVPTTKRVILKNQINVFLEKISNTYSGYTSIKIANEHTCSFGDKKLGYKFVIKYGRKIDMEILEGDAIIETYSVDLDVDKLTESLNSAFKAILNKYPPQT